MVDGYITHQKYSTLNSYYEVTMISKAKVVGITESVTFKQVMEESSWDRTSPRKLEKTVKI